MREEFLGEEEILRPGLKNAEVFLQKDFLILLAASKLLRQQPQL